MSTYHARVERDGRFWVIHIREIDRWTQARHLREVETMARDLVAGMLDIEPDSFDLEVDVDLPESVKQHVANARRLREEAATANSAAAEESRAAARELAAQDMPLRDVGQLLGISYQRAHQLVSS